MRILTEIELSAYLPYGIQVIAEDDNEQEKTFALIGIISGMACVIDEEQDYNFDLDEIKPILRPLSDLTENHVDDSPYLTKVQLEEEILNGCCPYVIWIDLVQQHFDIFDLIDNGLAIDINTIKP